MMMFRLLSSQGHQVEAAPNVEEALQAAEHGEFDLVVSDVGLPDASGHELMVRLRQRRPGIRGIAISGFGMEEDVRRSLSAGFAAHVTKPVDMARLLDTIDRVGRGK